MELHKNVYGGPSSWGRVVWEWGWDQFPINVFVRNYIICPDLLRKCILRCKQQISKVCYHDLNNDPSDLVFIMQVDIDPCFVLPTPFVLIKFTRTHGELYCNENK